MSKYYVGAYAASPSSKVWQPTLESEYYLALKNHPLVKGIEHPFTGKIHPYDENWFLDSISSEWSLVITCIPGLMDKLNQNPQFGLASICEESRKLALNFYYDALTAINRINNHFGRSMVKAIEIHSGPSQSPDISSSTDSFHRSLEELLSWDWSDCEILVEHCDAYRQTHPAAKGFLEIEDEIKIISSLNKNDPSLGILINWGRSVLEERNTYNVLKHIDYANNADILKGLIFSGCAAKDNNWGNWKDTHMPTSTIAENSLMTPQNIQNCLRLADLEKCHITGLKITAGKDDLNVEDRIQMISQGLNDIDSALN